MAIQIDHLVHRKVQVDLHSTVSGKQFWKTGCGSLKGCFSYFILPFLKVRGITKIGKLINEINFEVDAADSEISWHLFPSFQILRIATMPIMQLDYVSFLDPTWRTKANKTLLLNKLTIPRWGNDDIIWVIFLESSLNATDDIMHVRHGWRALPPCVTL